LYYAGSGLARRLFGPGARVDSRGLPLYRRGMQAELEAIIQRFGADTGSIHLLEDGVLRLAAQVGLPPHIVEIVETVPVGKGMAGLCVERNQPVSSCNIQVDASGDVRPAAKQTGVNGAIVVPIRDPDGAVRGTLGIAVHRVHEYSVEETERLLGEASRLLA
jgi:L-methionine (R)-S-oxide reductase